MISKMSANIPKSQNAKKKLSRQMAVVALLSAGILHPMLPVLALGTAGGTSIENTATATFDNPNGGTTTVESNKVTITVAEVAGITVANAGFTDVNGSSVTTNDVLYYDFRITNTGNDATGVYLPAPNVTGASLTSYTIINPTTGAVIATIPNTGGSTIDLNGLANRGILLADESYTVRVTVEVTATTVGADVTVTLGDGTAAAEGAPNLEVRTVDSPSNYATGEANPTGAPVNGEQEGTATNTVQVGVVPNYKSFATILKTNATPALNNVTISTDDTIQYGLQLKVDSSAPIGTTGYTTMDLLPVESVQFSSSKNGTSPSNKNVVIMSDRIPTNTRLAVSTDAGYSAPVVPTDSSGVVWKVWYAYDNTVASGNLATNSPLEEIWTDQAPANALEAATVKRIAFVKEGAVAKGVTTTVGNFTVVTNGMTTGGQVLNIAQVVGQSEAGSNKKLVYDESGDQNPSNFEGTTPDANSDLTFANFNSNTTVTGSVDTTNNTDPGGNNGTGLGGENNVVSIGAPLAAGLLNGPANAPSASGSNDNQDDFTNKTTNGVSGNQSASIALTSDPGAIPFTNTVASSVNLNNVVLRPISAATAKAVDNVAGNDTSYDVSAAIPVNTKVTITATVAGVVRTATYNYSGTDFVLESSTTGGASDGATPTPIIFASFNGGVSVNYTVEVDLPQTNTNSLQGYSIPIVAYVEGDGVGQTGYGDLNLSGNQDQSPNVTINRLYTGFIKVNKEIRVLDANGNPISDPTRSNISTFTATPTSQPKPGEILEYRITYENIATAPVAGSGSVSLSAGNFKVVEDGRATVNTWGLTTTHVLTKAAATNGTTSYYDSSIVVASPGPGVAEATSNTGYVNTIGTVTPNTSGTFTFQRKLN
jgi:hypothetical protein